MATSRPQGGCPLIGCSSLFHLYLGYSHEFRHAAPRNTAATARLSSMALARERRIPRVKPRWPKSLDHHGQPWHLPFKRKRRRSKEVEKNLRSLLDGCSRICVIVVGGSWEKLFRGIFSPCYEIFSFFGTRDVKRGYEVFSARLLWLSS